METRAARRRPQVKARASGDPSHLFRAEQSRAEQSRATLGLNNNWPPLARGPTSGSGRNAASDERPKPKPFDAGRESVRAPIEAAWAGLAAGCLRPLGADWLGRGALLSPLASSGCQQPSRARFASSLESRPPMSFESSGVIDHLGPRQALTVGHTTDKLRSSCANQDRSNGSDTFNRSRPSHLQRGDNCCSLETCADN